MNTYNKEHSYDLLKNASVAENHIDGIIFVNGQAFRLDKVYDVPKFVLFMLPKTAAPLLEMSAPTVTDTVLSYKHTYLDRCYLLNPITPAYFASCAVYGALFIIWGIYAFKIKRIYSQRVQKMMLMIPAFMFFDNLVRGLNYRACPWDEVINSSVKYIDMAEVSIVTLTQTMLQTFLYTLSNGWGSLTFSLNRN